MEWDILIILPQWKFIINIEVKRGAGLNSLKTAAKQADIHLGIFKRIFGAHLSSEWKFTKAACTVHLTCILQGRGNLVNIVHNSFYQPQKFWI